MIIKVNKRKNPRVLKKMQVQYSTTSCILQSALIYEAMCMQIKFHILPFAALRLYFLTHTFFDSASIISIAF